MSNKELDFISYNKITSKSDAFVTCEDLNCFVQYLPSTRVTSYNIKKEQHTAGTTEDFQDYAVPDVALKISPKKLRRINAFHKNNSESLLLNKFNIDPEIIYPTVVKEVITKQVDYSGLMLNPDQLEFLLALQSVRNKSVKENDTKLNIDEFSVTEDKVKSTSFELDARYSELFIGKGNGVLGSIPDNVLPQSFEESQIGDYIKKFGFNPNEVNVKKKFEVRKGNLQERPDVNNFLQIVNTDNSSSSNTISTGTQNTNNYNLLNINVDKSSGSPVNIKQSKTNNFRHELNFIDKKEINTFRNEVKISKNSIEQDIDVDKIHRRLLEGLNQSSQSNKYNYFTEIKSSRNYNIFDFKEVLNLTEKVSNNTNYVSLSTYYDHYRTINNNYNQIKNDLNFTNNQVEYLTKINFNNKNTINKLFSTHNTYRNSIMNMINNITKVQKLVFNENDLQFKAGLIKTMSDINRTNVIQVNQLKEQLNFSNINMTFMNQRMYRYEINKIEQTKKELNNLLNVFNENNFISNILTNKIGSAINQENILQLINLASDENHVKNVYYVLKQSTANIHAVKNIIDFVNLSKENNFNIDKINSQNISSINKILNMTNQNTNVLSSNKISNNIFSNKSINLSQEDISQIQISSNILKNINLSEVKSFSTILRSYKSEQNRNVLDTPGIQNTQNIFNKFDKNFKISNSNVTVQDLKTLNLITEKIDINKISNITRKISQLNMNNIEDIQQVSEIINLHSDTFEKINLLSSKVQKISKLTSIENITNKDIVELINIHKSTENKNSFKISQNINLSNRQVNNLINLSKSYSDNVSAKNTYLENVSQINIVSNFIKNNQLSNYKLSSTEAKEIANNLNVFSSNKTEIKKLSSIFSNSIIQNIDQSFVDNVNVFQTKISNFADKSKLKETIESLNVTNKNYNNIFSNYKISQIIKKSDLKENIEQINIFETGKNSTTINKYSFDNNKKKIQNLYSELNLVQENKIERRTSQNISQVFNELNQVTKDIKSELKNVIKEQRNILKSTNNFVRAVSKSQNLGQQNLYDFLSFSNYVSNRKTSNTAKYGDYNQVYNLLNVSKVEVDSRINRTVNKFVNEKIRLTQKTENISFDIHKISSEKVYKIFNTIKSTTNNYHEQREVEQKQEKLIEKKVDQLLTNKIETVTNSLVKNVLTKNEFDSIKKDIVYEILKIQNSTDEKIEQIKRETQQTVQNMLEKFLRS
jgi:hypothetical protein